MTRYRVQAQAKLNLYLRVLGKDGAGYHAIETLFIKLALHDIVHVDVSVRTRTVHCHGPTMPPDGLGAPEQNLAWRAACAFADASGWPSGFAIDVEKHIPVGGGLGGGSADAAAVLRALNHAAPTPLPTAQLMQLAGALGADVPFLTSDALLAWGWGRGDRLLALTALPERPVQLFSFANGVNTGAAYAALGVRGDQHAGGAYVKLEDVSSWEAISALAANDFERVVPSMHAGVARWLPLLRDEAARLRARGEDGIGMMSGSGATCFLVYAEGGTPAWPGVSAGERLIQTRTASAIVPPERIA